jgi:serine/threonine-protein kinase
VAQGSSQQLAGVAEGQILAGKYRVERVLGVGGMGVVVAASHIELDTLVALKFLLPTLLSNQEAVARFARESRAAVKIQNEHVARVLDVGVLDNGAPYMVMEFLEGGDLAEWLRQRGPMPVEQAVEFVLQACVAVADAHGLGIVHRDLKPSNLFCVRRSDGQLVIKVLDFGISKVTGASGASSPGGSVTQTAALVGSPLYMSPEQMQAPKSVDALTDIWSVGIILYELLVGRVPFNGETVAEVAVNVATRLPPAIRDFRPDVPAELEAAIFKCLEKDRRGRYRNVAELALALAPFGPRRSRASVERISGIIQSAGLSASALSLPPSPQGPSTLVSAGTIPPVGRTAAPRAARGRGRTVLVAVVGAVGLLLVAGLIGLRIFQPPYPRAPLPPSLESATGPSPGPPSAAAALPSGLATTALVNPQTPSSNPPAEATPLAIAAALDTATTTVTAPPPPSWSATHPHPAPPSVTTGEPPKRVLPAPTASATSSGPSDPLSKLRVK